MRFSFDVDACIPFIHCTHTVPSWMEVAGTVLSGLLYATNSPFLDFVNYDLSRIVTPCCCCGRLCTIGTIRVTPERRNPSFSASNIDVIFQ